MTTTAPSPLRTFPGARRPDRQRRVSAYGVELAVSEWGEERDPAILLAHGGFDFTGTFDVFAPLLADAGWRVVAWDQRGHGDSDRAGLYSWEAEYETRSQCSTPSATAPSRWWATARAAR